MEKIENDELKALARFLALKMEKGELVWEKVKWKEAEPGPAWKTAFNGQEMIIGAKVSNSAIMIIFQVLNLETSEKKLYQCVGDAFIIRSPFTKLFSLLLRKEK